MDHNTFKRLQATDLVEVSVEELTPIPPGSNPYLHDRLRSGMNLPKGWMIMFEMSKPGALEEVVLVNQLTGQRVKVEFAPKYPQLNDIIKHVPRQNNRWISSFTYVPKVHANGIDWIAAVAKQNEVLTDNIYVLWRQFGSMYYVRATLFIDTVKFPQQFAAFAGIEVKQFDEHGIYLSDVMKLTTTYSDPNNPPPPTSKNVTATPFGLNE